jgi:hypothetical protein
VNRGDAVTSWSTEITAPLALLEQVADCTKTEFHEYLTVLDHAGLAWVDWDEHPPTVKAGRSTGGIGWPILRELKEFAGGDPAIVRRVLVDLDFSAFDA